MTFLTDCWFLLIFILFLFLQRKTTIMLLDFTRRQLMQIRLWLHTMATAVLHTFGLSALDTPCQMQTKPCLLTKPTSRYRVTGQFTIATSTCCMPRNNWLNYRPFPSVVSYLANTHYETERCIKFKECLAKGGWRFWCLPPIWNLGCQFDPTILYPLVLLPSPVAHSVLSVTAFWPILLTSFLPKSPFSER